MLGAMMIVGIRVQQRREQLGLSQAELGELVGVSQQAVNLIETGKTKNPRYIVSLAKALQTSTDWLQGTSENVNEAAATTQPPVSNVVPAPGVSVPTPLEMPRNLPVRGSAACSSGNGAFQIETDVVDWVRRPPILNGISDAYALYLTGDSMEPKWSSGDLVLVHPKRPVRPGDHVVLILQDGPHETPYAFCKRLVRRHGGIVTVEQYNPRGTRDFQESNIMAIHRVLEMGDLF